MMAALSMTHESGFHMNPKNLSTLLSCHSSQANKREKKVKPLIFPGFLK